MNLSGNVTVITGGTTGIGRATMAGLVQAQPIQHVARPGEISKVACFLLSQESSYVTGALVAADGGYTAQ